MEKTEYKEQQKQILESCDGSSSSDKALMELKQYYEMNKEVTKWNVTNVDMNGKQKANWSSSVALVVCRK